MARTSHIYFRKYSKDAQLFFCFCSHINRVILIIVLFMLLILLLICTEFQSFTTKVMDGVQIDFCYCGRIFYKLPKWASYNIIVSVFLSVVEKHIRKLRFSARQRRRCKAFGGISRVSFTMCCCRFVVLQKTCKYFARQLTRKDLTYKYTHMCLL